VTPLQPDRGPTTASLVGRVRERLRADRTDPADAPDAVARLARAEVRRHNELALARGGTPIDDEAGHVRDVLAAVTGLGPLQPYLDDPEVEELWINAPDRVYIARAGVSERTPLQLTDSSVRDLVERMLHATGRRVDLSQPFVDASLPDGSRLHVVIGGIARRHWAVNADNIYPRVEGSRSESTLTDDACHPRVVRDSLDRLSCAVQQHVVPRRSQTERATDRFVLEPGRPRVRALEVEQVRSSEHPGHGTPGHRHSAERESPWPGEVRGETRCRAAHAGARILS
jgi:hypothetical protein